MNRILRTSLIAAALAGSAGLAVAQGQAQGRHEPHAFSRPTERVEARLAYVKTALKITDAQQAQWNAFADSERRLAAEREKTLGEWREKMAQRRQEQAQGQGERARPGAIERLAFAEKMHQAAAARIDAQLAAIKPLYASLSAEQKKVADAVLVPQHRGRHGGFGAFARRSHGHGGERA